MRPLFHVWGREASRGRRGGAAQPQSLPAGQRRDDFVREVAGRGREFGAQARDLVPTICDRSRAWDTLYVKRGSMAGILRESGDDRLQRLCKVVPARRVTENGGCAAHPAFSVMSSSAFFGQHFS